MNKFTGIGNLTRDPEIRTTQGGITVCLFCIAISRRFKDANGQKGVDYINVTAWRQLGELCGQYLEKGRKVGVTGSIQTRTYEAQDGSKRSAFEIVADEVEFLSQAQQGGHTNHAAAQDPPPRQSGSFDAEQQGFTQVDDDDLPF